MGNWVVQIGKVIGAEVVATAGTGNVELVKSLGADEVVDYRKSSLRQWAEGKSNAELADVVLAGTLGAALTDAWYAFKDGGALVSIVQPPEQLKPLELERNLKVCEFFIMHPDGANLAAITKWIEERRVKPVVDSVFAFEDFKKAFERSDGGHARGKVVLKL